MQVMKREKGCLGRRVMVVKVQGKRSRGRPNRRWLDSVRADGNRLLGRKFTLRVQPKIRIIMTWWYHCQLLYSLKMKRNSHIIMFLICYYY